MRQKHAHHGGQEPTGSRPALTLELPDDIYEYVRRTAKGMNQPVEKALVQLVRAATPSLDKVPAEDRAELRALEDLGDDALWDVLRSRLGATEQRRLERLLAKNKRDSLTDRDRQALTTLQDDANWLMLRRSYAALLLKSRGHGIPKLEDF